MLLRAPDATQFEVLSRVFHTLRSRQLYFASSPLVVVRLSATVHVSNSDLHWNILRILGEIEEVRTSQTRIEAFLQSFREGSG